MRRILWAWLCALCLLCAAAAAEGGADYYAENEWNFVEQAMDVSGGIPESASGALAQIQRRGVLRVAMSREATPTVFVDAAKTGADRLSGPDVELAGKIAERMGVTLRIVPLDPTQILLSLTEEQCDLAISALAFTPARALQYTFSRGYYYPENPDTVAVILREGKEISSLEDLEGMILVTQSRSIPETLAVRQIRNYLEFRRVSSAQTVFEEVRRSKADAGLVMESAARLYMKRNPDSELHLAEGIALTPDRQFQGYRVAARRGENELIAFVNGVIGETLADGSYERWMQESKETGTQEP